MKHTGKSLIIFAYLNPVNLGAHFTKV